MKLRRQQTGVSIIAAIFLITGLALLGALMTRMTSIGNTAVINEWYSAQALYSAESGTDWAAYDIIHGGNGEITNAIMIADRAWFTTAIPPPLTIGDKRLYTITSTGTAGVDVAAPSVQRQIEVQFLP